MFARARACIEPQHFSIGWGRVEAWVEAWVFKMTAKESIFCLEQRPRQHQRHHQAETEEAKTWAGDRRRTLFGKTQAGVEETAMALKIPQYQARQIGWACVRVVAELSHASLAELTADTCVCVYACMFMQDHTRC